MTVFKLFPLMCHLSYVTFFLLRFEHFYFKPLGGGSVINKPTQPSLIINKNCSIEERGLRLIKMVFKYWFEMYFENKLYPLFIIDLNTLGDIFRTKKRRNLNNISETT